MNQSVVPRFATWIAAPLRARRPRLGDWMVFIALAICVLSYVTFDRQKQHILLSAQKNLASIADLKAGEITHWRKERIDDAVALTESTRLATIFEDWLRAGAPANAEREWMLTRLGVMQRSQNYTALSLLDTQGMPRLSLDAKLHSDGYVKHLAVQAMRSDQVFMSDLHLGSSGTPEIDLIAPLRSGSDKEARVVGALYFEIDPARFLFPLIQTWPTESQTAETLLVRREGNQVLFLNPLRHRDDRAMTLQLPLGNSDLPAAQAAQGKTGFINSKDYRGKPVATYLRQIPGTGWAMVSKIDEDEIYAPVRQLALWTSGITLLLLGASFAMFWLQMHRIQLVARNRQLRQEKKLLGQRFEDLSRFANDIFFLTDESSRIVEVNDQAIQVYGYPRAEMLQMHSANLRAAEASPQFNADWQTVLAQGHANYETVHRRKDGSSFAVDVSARVLHLEHGRFVQIILRDISKRKATEQRLHYLAYYDDLTGLPNHTLFNDHLCQAMATADRHQKLVGILFMDLDDFKIVNDTLGHESGNTLLRAVASRLKTCFREGDTIARFGGDEFAVVLADMSHVDDASNVAQKIKTTFEPPFDIDGHEIFVTLSIGITLYPFDDNDTIHLLRNADTAMYQAKAMGRGNFQFYSVELTQRAQKRMALETGLRHALERNEFVLHYQPQMDLKTGHMIGVEALIRWMQPGQGMVSPAEFIPVAEESGLIVPIGEWVLRTACAQAKTWQDQGFHQLLMAVNLSSRQFSQGHLVELVKTVLQDTGLLPQYLELEITESILMDESDSTVLSALNEFKQMGITLSIDDFGTGYSSLSYLKRFPIDKLKIDQSFVHGITSNPENASLIQAIIAMARSLRLTVIAEGVETEEQYDHLHHHDCDQMQGYFFSRPLPAEQIGDLFKATYRMQTGTQKNKQLPLSFS
jgi:diguanylate cyclase (GGDEF)-like protein/PAS domain S-box-containing protein